MKKNENQIDYQNGDSELLNGFVNSQKAMQLLNCKQTTLYYLRIREKLLVYSKIGNKIFYQLESITKLIEKNRTGGENQLI